MMTRFSTQNQSSNRCCAVACSSVQIIDMLNTAVILAVFICVLCLLPLRILV